MNRTLSKIVIASVAIAAVIFGGTRLNGRDVISRASAQHGPNSEPAQVRAELEKSPFLYCVSEWLRTNRPECMI
jgi:hypothetical protein